MLKKLKSLFIIEEEVKASSPKSSTSTSNTNSNKGKSSSSTANEDIPVDVQVKAPEKFINSLLSAIEKNNMEGFDYLEFKQSLKSLDGMDMDELTRYNSAFAMAKTMGATKTNLINSAKHYIGILSDEKSKFNDAYQKQKEKQVIAREEKLKSLEASIEKKKAQIKKLQQEIIAAETQLEKKKNEINSAAAKVSKTRDQFFAAHKKVNDQIELDIKRMNKYLTK